MKLRPTLLPLLLLSACASPADEETQSEADLATEGTAIACTPPQATSDGRHVVYASCPTAWGQAVQIQRTAGARLLGARIESDEKLLVTGASGLTAYWIKQRGNGELKLETRTLAGTFPQQPIDVSFPLAPRTVDAFERLEDGTVAILVTAESGVQHLVTGLLGVTPLVALALEGSNRLFVASADTLVAARVAPVIARPESTIRSWRTIERRASGAPAIGPELRPAQELWRFADGSMNGKTFIADVRPTPSTHAIAEVNIHTGAVKVRTEGFWHIASVVADRQHVWYTARRSGSAEHVLQHLELAGFGGAGPTTLLSAAEPITAHLSRDASTLLFRTGADLGPNALGTIAADGSSPPRFTIERSDAKLVVVEGDGRQRSGRYLVSVRPEGEIASPATLQLVDETTAEVLGEWKEKVDFDRRSSAVLSADGKVVYARRDCNATTSQRGRQWVQLWPAPSVITGCETNPDSDGDAVALPNSSAVMLSSGRPGPSLVRILRP